MAAPADPSTRQRETLARDHVHERWEGQFSEPENQAFYDWHYDRILDEVGGARGGRILDVGCGRGAHAIRLARRGYHVVGTDFSDAVLDMARGNVRAAGLDASVELVRDDVTAMAFEDGAFEGVLCWGVLMHVPDLSPAVAELARIVAPGGHLIVHEQNLQSPEAAMTVAAKRLLGRSGGRRTPSGVGDWVDTPAGPVFTRRGDLRWLTGAFESHGLELRRRMPSQLTELYARPLPARAKAALHAVNMLWARRVGLSGPAVGNTLIFRRPIGSP